MVLSRELSYNLGGTISSMGLPVNGVVVKLYDYWRQSSSLSKHFLCQQQTDASGMFSFDVRKGIYCLEIIPGENTRYARQSIEAIKVTANTNFNVALRSGLILSGNVRNSEGKSISDAELLIFGIEPHVIRVSQPLADDGSFSISLAQGKYYVALKHLDKGRGKAADLPFVCPYFQALDLQKDLKHDISLPPLLSFKGKVSNKEGHPLAGVRAIVASKEKPENIFAKEVSLKVEALTKKDGGFECLLQSGTYSVRLLPPEDFPLAEKSLGAILVDHDRERNYALEPGYELKGRVMHNGMPVPNATVNAIGVNLDSLALTDAEGNYHFSLPGGSYELVAAAQPDSMGSTQVMELAPYKGELILDQDCLHDIEMEAGTLVAGVVQDPAKQPRGGVLLTLYATNDGQFDANCARRRPLWIGITGDDGSYEIRLQPDKYWLVLNNQASTGHLVDVSESAVKGDLTIDDVCLVNFEVVSENDEPIPNCQVSFEAYELLTNNNNSGSEDDEVEEIPMPVFTDNNGKCTFTLAQGVYSFDFHPPQHSSHESRLIRQLSVSADMTRRVRLLSRKVEVLS